MLRILAAINGLLILFLVLLKWSAMEIGVRTTGNIFTSTLGNVSVSSLIFVILFVFETVLIFVLFRPSQR
jgi:hypothetical protein